MARVAGYCGTCRTNIRDGASHRSTAKHVDAMRRRADAGRVGGESLAKERGRAIGRFLSEPDDDHYRARLEAAGEVAPAFLESFDPVEIGDPEPAAPAAMRDHRPEPCERCGQSFRTEKGAAWHRANNPRCTRWAPARARLARAS